MRVTREFSEDKTKSDYIYYSTVPRLRSSRGAGRLFVADWGPAQQVGVIYVFWPAESKYETCLSSKLQGKLL